MIELEIEEELEEIEKSRHLLRVAFPDLPISEKAIKEKIYLEFEKIYYDSAKELMEDDEFKIEAYELSIINELYNIIKTKI